MVRTGDWVRQLFNSTAAATFHRVFLGPQSAGDTITRIHFQAWAETLQVIPGSGFPLLPLLILVQVIDGPISTWDSAHPSGPAESSYGWMHYERVNFSCETHTIESAHYTRYIAPYPDSDRDIKSQRKIKANGDGIEINCWLDTAAGYGINPFAVNFFGAAEYFFLGP